MLPYDPSTQVPLLVRGPGIARGRVLRALVGNVDLGAGDRGAGARRPGKPFDGTSLVPFARKPDKALASAPAPRGGRATLRSTRT